jgi:hypothetical protein
MMKKSTGFLLFIPIIMGVLIGWAAAGHAMTVTKLDITDGSVKYGGRYQHFLNRLLDQDGVVKMGEYQPIGDIVPSITRGHHKFSLFTSGMQGTPAPSATIEGSSITVDLSSLYFGVSRGGSIQLWSIGGFVTGTIDPITSQFSLLWKDPVPRPFGGWSHGRPREAAFLLEGAVLVGEAPTPVPLPAGLTLYATGLLGLGSWAWLKRRAVGIG